MQHSGTSSTLPTEAPTEAPRADRGQIPSSPAFSIFPALLALAVLGTQAYLAIGRNFANVIQTPFLPYCLLGTFAIHMATRPGRRERWWTILLGAAGIVFFVGFSGKFRSNWASFIGCGAFPGLASLTVLAIQVLRTKGNGRTEKLNTLFAGSVFGYSALFIASVLDLTTKLHPQTYDLYLYAVDQGYGLPIAARAAQLLARQPVLLWTCALVYESLPLAVSLLYAYQRSGATPLGIRVLPAFIGGGVAVYILYNILPAIGPHYVFGLAFPDHLPPSPGLHLVALGNFPRNAIPSMHLGCALLLFWNCRRISRWVYAASGVYLVLTALATLGLGEHFVVDLVVGVPYVLALQAVCAPAVLRLRGAWKQTAWVGIALTVAWIAAVRFGTPLFRSVTFTWGASVATLLVCGWLRCRMHAGESELRADSAGCGAESAVSESEVPAYTGGLRTTS